MVVGGQGGPHADPAHLAMPILNSSLAVLALPMVAVVVLPGPKLQGHFAVCRMGAEGQRFLSDEKFRICPRVTQKSPGLPSRTEGSFSPSSHPQSPMGPDTLPFERTRPPGRSHW